MIQPPLRRLEELGLNACAAPGQLLYDGWVLRFTPGQVKRARSVNAVYPSTLPLREKIACCEDLYRSRGLPAVFRVTAFSEPPELDAALDALGYARVEATAVETATIDPTRLLRSDARALPLPEWVEAIGNLRGSPAQERAQHLRRLEVLPLPLCALALHQNHCCVATGLAVVEGGWAGLFDIAVDGALRRQGLGLRMVNGLLHAAWELGARQAYLQVGSDNGAARSLYARFGFAQRYPYWYRCRPA